MTAITTGSIVVGLLLGVTSVAAILGGGRRWKANWEAEHERANRVTTELTEAKHDIGALEARPNYDQIMELLNHQEAGANARTATAVGEVLTRLDARFDNMVTAAEERHRAIITTLEAITVRLNGEEGRNEPRRIYRDPDKSR